MRSLSARGRRTRLATIVAGCLLLGSLSTVAVAWACAIFVDVPGDVYGRAGVRSPARWSRIYISPPADGSAEPAPLTPVPPEIAETDRRPSVFITAWHGPGSVYILSETDSGYFVMPADAVPLNESVPPVLHRQSMPWITGDAPWPRIDADLHIGARGWPFLAFWCEFETRGPNPTTFLPWVGAPVGGVELPWPQVRPDWYIPPPPVTSLPYRPLWLGLTLNTFIFAAAWWVLLFGRGIARRSLRRRRGLCPACAYDLRATPVGSPCPECGAIPKVARKNL